MFRSSTILGFAFSKLHSRYLVVGGGSGGLSITSHLIRSGIDAHQIRMIDPSPYHYYQPGWTMVGAGMWQIHDTQQEMERTIPAEVNLERDAVTLIKPEENTVVTKSGQEYTYDELVVASGLQLQYDKVEGLKEALDDPNSKVASIYQLHYAEKMARIADNLQSGQAIFTEPPLPIKCAGAPQKILYLWTDKWSKGKKPISVEFMKSNALMFGVPKYSEALTKVAKDHGIKTNFKHRLVKVSGNEATFQNTDTKERVIRKFDLLHVVPPMGAHSYIAESGLADEAGYLDCDKHTLRHNKYKNIWGIGDCTSLPCSKTAAAVFSETEALHQNMLAVARDPKATKLPGKYTGYASCPLFTGKLRLMLAQFKYGGEVDETFYNNQQKPRYQFYFMKRFIFPLAYWFFVPRGLWAGRKGIRWV